MSPGNYLFGRDLRASIRLNYQHWAIKQLCGFTIHPSITTIPRKGSSDPEGSPDSSPSFHIADIGTGTGLLPIELSQQAPTANIVGFDVSNAQYPPFDWVPRNINLEVHDAFKPFPGKYLGKFDIVNIRFFVTLLKTEAEVRQLLQNLTGLLKPGGYLQWLDANPTSATATSLNPSIAKSATERLVALMRQPYPSANYDWIPGLPAALTSSNLEVVSNDTYSSASFPPSHILWNQCYLLGYQEFWEHMILKGQKEGDAEVTKKAADSIAELEIEFGKGASMEVEYFCVVAQKTKG